MKRMICKLGAIACVIGLCAGLMAGCSGAAAGSESTQQASRSYMSKVNGIMDQLGQDLDTFVDAVSRGDVVNMRTQADNAYRSLDDLAKLEPPEELSDVQQSYVDGTNKLREALDGYIDLYTEIDAGTFDQSKYEERLAAVKKTYDEGVELLKKGDETAAGK